MRLLIWIAILFSSIVLSNVLVDWMIGEGFNLNRGYKFYLVASVISIVLGAITHQIMKTQDKPSNS